MKKITLLLAALFAVMAVSFLGVACERVPDTDTTAPVLTVTNVPTTCNVGEKVTLPAATATDDVDGDVSAKIKLTVSQLKADNETVNRDIIFEKAGNVEQSFDVTSNTLLTYKIVYVVKDAAGNKAEQTFTLTAVPDTETGTLVVNESSVDGFSFAQGITGKAGVDVTLPSATAIDQPGDKDISDLVTARLYEKVNGVASDVIFTSWTDFSEVKNVRIPAGSYDVVYSVRDAAGNTFETTVSFPVEIAQPDEENMAYDPKNFAFDTDDGIWVNGKPGLSWLNEYGELAFGNTSDEANLDQTVGYTSALTKIHEQYVGVAFNADVPTTNGQTFYTMSARGSKNRETVPNKETCTWPNYLFIRIGAGRIESRVERQSDKEMTTIKGYEKGLLDGKDHVVYVQWKNEGEAPDAPGAAIRLYGWIDKVPGGADNADFIFEAKVGEAIAQGTLTQEIFTELWNESTGAGWFAMDTYSGNKPHDDDHMRIKGFVVYDAEETEFAADILPPVVDVDFTVAPVYAAGEEIAIPQATVTGANEAGVKSYIVDPEGNKVDVENVFTPENVGYYTLVYAAYDEAGNFGYKAFELKVAVRDNQAPELTLSSTDTITVNVGEEVVLPTATAIDNLEGDISSSVKVEIVGTEHVTTCANGGTYYPMTAGEQTVIYTVSDPFGNVAEQRMTVVANTVATGNMLDRELTTAQGGVGLANKEYIYDQKVSMIFNIEKQSSVIQFNARGPVKNVDWPNGIVIRITEIGGIDVSAAWHDHCIYGRTSYAGQKYWLGCDILFEYQVKNVVVDGVEYIRVQIWVQGEPLVFEADAEKGGLVGLEENVTALYRKVSDFVDEQEENIYSSPFWVATNQATITIKELRIDGTSCVKPADPVIPEGYEVKFGSGNNFVTETVSVPGGGDVYQEIGKHSNEEFIAITFNGEEAVKGAFCVNVTGVATGWSGGLVIRISQDGTELRVGGPNATCLARYNAGVYQGGIDAKSYTIVYKLTYNFNSGIAESVVVDMWFGEAGNVLAKLVPQVAEANLCAYDSENDVFTVSSKAFSNAENMTPLAITVVSLGALNGDCDWTVTKIEKLAAAPGTQVEGYANPVNNNASTVLLTEATTYPGTDDSIVKAVENLNESYVAITMSYNADASYYAMGINLLGTTANGWNAGLVLALTQDGTYFRVGGVNNANLVQLNVYSMGQGAPVTIAYKLTYIKVGELCTDVQIEIWNGENKVAPHGEVTSGEKWSYDVEKGAFIFDYNIVEESQFAPDCTLIMMGAFNNKDIDCNWTVSNVVVGDEAPGGYNNPVNDDEAIVLLSEATTYPGTNDSIVKAVEHLNENYVSITMSHNADASYYAMGINLLGTTTNGWNAGLVLALTTDGAYFRVGGVNNANLVQLNVYSMGQGNKVCITYKLTYLGVAGKSNKVMIEVWNNENKVAPHGEVTSGEKWAYDTEKGAFIFDCTIVEEAQYAPDCTLIMMGAFNDKDVDCNWTIHSVGVLPEKTENLN